MTASEGLKGKYSLIDLKYIKVGPQIPDISNDTECRKIIPLYGNLSRIGAILNDMNYVWQMTLIWGKMQGKAIKREFNLGICMIYMYPVGVCKIYRTQKSWIISFIICHTFVEKKFVSLKNLWERNIVEIVKFFFSISNKKTSELQNMRKRNKSICVTKGSRNTCQNQGYRIDYIMHQF